MSAINGELVTQVRQAIDAAHQSGQPAPGRPTLVRLTGATDHAVRRALAELVTERVNAGEPDPIRSIPRTDHRSGNPASTKPIASRLVTASRQPQGWTPALATSCSPAHRCRLRLAAGWSPGPGSCSGR